MPDNLRWAEVAVRITEAAHGVKRPPGMTPEAVWTRFLLEIGSPDSRHIRRATEMVFALNRERLEQIEVMRRALTMARTALTFSAPQDGSQAIYVEALTNIDAALFSSQQ